MKKNYAEDVGCVVLGLMNRELDKFVDFLAKYQIQNEPYPEFTRIDLTQKYQMEYTVQQGKNRGEKYLIVHLTKKNES